MSAFCFVSLSFLPWDEWRRCQGGRKEERCLFSAVSPLCKVLNRPRMRTLRWNEDGNAIFGLVLGRIPLPRTVNWLFSAYLRQNNWILSRNKFFLFARNQLFANESWIFGNRPYTNLDQDKYSTLPNCNCDFVPFLREFIIQSLTR